MGRAKNKVRYAVIGAGNISQVAVLPAFANARENSELVAVVSSDARKRSLLAERYQLEHSGSYEELEEVLARGAIDAVYITTPNEQHRAFTERAAKCGVHVLCEKPMAVSVADCEAMIAATRAQQVKLMIAYRLHFEEANLRAIDLARRGQLGSLKAFSSVFTQEVRAGDIRTKKARGGGALYDLGVYPINAVRALFAEEPVEVAAFAPPSGDPRFAEVDETSCVLLRFPSGRVAQLTVSMGASGSESMRVIGTAGELRVEPCYGYSSPHYHYLTRDGETSRQKFAARDQFAPELIYFSRCVLEDREPEPSGEEGLCDVRVVCAALEAAASGRPVSLPPFLRSQRPELSQNIHKPPLPAPKLIDAPAPTV
jgi:predicted dehydrogenase